MLFAKALKSMTILGKPPASKKAPRELKMAPRKLDHKGEIIRMTAESSKFVGGLSRENPDLAMYDKYATKKAKKQTMGFTGIKYPTEVSRFVLNTSALWMISPNGYYVPIRYVVFKYFSARIPTVINHYRTEDDVIICHHTFESDEEIFTYHTDNDAHTLLGCYSPSMTPDKILKEIKLIDEREIKRLPDPCEGIRQSFSCMSSNPFAIWIPFARKVDDLMAEKIMSELSITRDDLLRIMTHVRLTMFYKVKSGHINHVEGIATHELLEKVRLSSLGYGKQVDSSVVYKMTSAKDRDKDDEIVMFIKDRDELKYCVSTKK